jgi:hypothetical protein
MRVDLGSSQHLKVSVSSPSKVLTHWPWFWFAACESRPTYDAPDPVWGTLMVV